ncbi:MAG: NAD(P)/FAD-dependent oxidoreductase, partial [Chromatiales bacterium]|nr:NAD(P)/FAD-dependent oxidoreductase [Chromatiales bacterium]
MKEVFGLVVIGAGPAGMSAAVAAREHGADVLVLDEQAVPGGQIYRNVETVLAERPETARVLGRDYAAGAALVHTFRRCGAEYSPRTSVWEVSTVARREDARAPVEIGVLRDGVAEIVRAHCVIVASGAQERAVPVPGATLPGVMGAGGTQALLKGAGLVPDVPVVIAGSGPLVYLVAWQLVRAEAPVRAVLLTMPSGWMGRAGGTLPEALAMPGALCKGLEWRGALAARGVKVMRVRDLAIEGRERVESVDFRHRGRERSMRASLVLLHEGVIPNAHLTLAARLDHVWDARQHAFRPAVDEWGRTSEPGVLVAGDGARVLGAEAAVETGRIAALEAAYRLGRIRVHQRDVLARSHRASLARHRRFREFLDLTFEPVQAVRRPSDPEVTVCRCEEVTLAEIKRVIAHGCPGPHQAKAFTRCGMGPCQGRMCATVVSELFAERRHVGVGAVGHYRIRPPV